MGKTYLRVLSIRRHKTITFMSVYSNKFGTIQVMSDNDVVKDINCGDLLDCNIIDDINNRGNVIKRILSINNRIECISFPSYKGVGNEICNQDLENYLNARNCGSQLNILKFKSELLNNIQNMLNRLDFFDATGLLNTVENYATGSGIDDAVIKDREINQPKYLRVTMENQLKQMTATILKSTYALEKVYRNMGEDASHINEFLMLELVDIEHDMNKMLEFVKQLDILAKTLGDKNNIYVPNKELEIIDYSELNPFIYENIRTSFSNTVVINYPCESPFILKDQNGKRKEVRWYVNGHWIGHYYQDEYDYKNVREVLEKQIKENTKEDINPMSYFEWGIPKSISLGLSIDRWLQMLLNLNHINSIANPIELDFKRRIR